MTEFGSKICQMRKMVSFGLDIRSKSGAREAFSGLRGHLSVSNQGLKRRDLLVNNY